MLRIISYIFIVFLLSSCITNQDLDVFISESEIDLEVYDYDYKISTGDLLYVEVKSMSSSKYDFFNNFNDNPQSKQLNNPYTIGYLVNDSGYIDLPTLGKIHLLGKTTAEAEMQIYSIAKNYLVNPFVKLVFLNLDVSIIGEVNNPGRYNFSNPQPTIFDLIGEANGFTPVANRKKIKLIRTQGNNPGIHFIDISKISTSNSEFFYLRRGDVLTIEPYEKKFFAVNNITQLFSIVISTLSLYLLINQSE